MLFRSETLKGAQTYLLIGNGAALFLLALALGGRVAPGATERDLAIPFVGVTAPTFTAAVMALGIYLLSGLMALRFASHRREIEKQVSGTLLAAALTYPTMLTTGKKTATCAALLPVLLQIGALMVSFPNKRGGALAAALLCSAPYLVLVLDLWKPRKTHDKG